MSKPGIKYVAEYIVAPVLFLTVALTAGIRFQIGTNAFQFIYPPLVSCIIGALATVLLLRCAVFGIAESRDEDQGLLDSASRLVLVAAVYLSTVQIFSAVTPERGLLSLFFNLFYLLILINDLFVVFNPKRLAGALAAVLVVSFLLKYLLLADLFAPSSSWGKYIFQELVKAGSLGALDQEPFAPATGYLAFFSVALYVLGLYLIAPRVTRREALLYRLLSHRSALSPSERVRLLSAIVGLDRDSESLTFEVSDLTRLPQAAQCDSKSRPSLPPG